MLSKSYREIMTDLRGEVFGQPDAMDRVERSLKIAQSGLRDADKPLAVLFLAGPTGTGKSETPEALSRLIHGSPEALCRIDCNNLKAAHSTSSLTGSPPGYIGSQGGDTLLNKTLIEGSPGCPGILVLEEIEKADPEVHDVLLGIFDKGSMTLNNGAGQISFANTLIFLTSNIGSRELAQAAQPSRLGFASMAHGRQNPAQTSADRHAIIRRELERRFRPEFIGRLDDIIVYGWLDTESAHAITRKFLNALKEKLGRFPHLLKVDASAIDFLVERGFNQALGGRTIKAAIRRYIEDPLSEALADGLLYPASFIYIDHEADMNELTLSYYEADIPSTPQQREPLALEASAPVSGETSDYPEVVDQG